MTPGRKFSTTTSAAVDQAPGDREVGGVLEVEDDAALAALEDGVGVRAPARAAGRVDADDVGALVGEHHGVSGPARYWPKSMTRTPSRTRGMWRLLGECSN